MCVYLYLDLNYLISFFALTELSIMQRYIYYLNIERNNINEGIKKNIGKMISFLYAKGSE